jgi:hypothetical protein
LGGPDITKEVEVFPRQTGNALLGRVGVIVCHALADISRWRANQ